MTPTDDDGDTVPAPWTYLALTSWWTIRYGLMGYREPLPAYIERRIKEGNYIEDTDE